MHVLLRFMYVQFPLLYSFIDKLVVYVRLKILFLKIIRVNDFFFYRRP